MATDRLINNTQGDSIITALGTIATNIENYSQLTLQALGGGYSTCSTAASTTAKTATLAGYSLNEGALVSIKFTNAVPASATLNINSQGAKAIYYNGSAITAGIISAGDIATFLYTNNQYQLVNVDTLITKKQDALAFEGTYNSSQNKVTTMSAVKDGKLTGYAKQTGNVAATDSVVNAIGKLETKVDTNESNILSITPTYYQDTTTTIGTTYTLVPNCAMTIPAQTIVTVSAALSYGQSAPRGVILSFSNNSGDYDNEFNLLSKVESSTNVILSTTAQIPNYSANVRTVYVWCKSSTQAINPVFSTMQKAVSSQ